MQSIFILLLTLGCISIVSTYKCYFCVSGINGGCEDPFDANGMVDGNKVEALPGGACMKTKLTTKSGTLVTRSSTEFSLLCLGGINGCKEESEGGVTGTICCCTSNLCNGVSTVQQKPLIVFLIVGTLAVFPYRWY